MLQQRITSWAMGGKYVFGLLPTSYLCPWSAFLTAHDSVPRFGVEFRLDWIWAHDIERQSC